MVSAIDLVDDAIADLQARLNLNPSATKGGGANNKQPQQKKPGNNNKKGGGKPKQPKQPPKAEPPADQPEICKLEFKVGVITKVWLQ